MNTNIKNPFFPPFTREVFIALGLSGIASLIVFDVFGQLIAPAFGFVELAPVALAEEIIVKVIGVTSKAGAFVLHILTGLLFYPIGYLFIARPIAQKVAPVVPWWIVGFAYGVVIWLWAVVIMAPFAGWPIFIGFSEFTWVALVGHIIFGMVDAAVIHWRLD